ncbi:MAG TPA: hypothetical protein VMV10_08920 [Pirellulales bacterium]|nr:hypothetical protein [Pirellulales bacterium]
MTAKNASVKTTLRIPGAWLHPGELLQRMPPGFRLTPETLVLPDGVEIELAAMPPDEQFAGIFQSSCRRPATDEELAIVGRYTVNIGLSGPGGSREAALAMMKAGAAIVRAGGAGVFIDNSALAHGGGDWIEMADDGGPDALSFAFVSVVRGEREMWTMGMHVLGFPEIVMRRADGDAETIIEVVRYVSAGDKPIGDGHLLADDHGLLRFRVAAMPDDRCNAGSPMHNPFGRLRLTSLKEIAEGN